MPVAELRFENGIFFAKASGNFDKTDAIAWVGALRRYAQQSFSPVAAVVDMREVEFIPVSARVVLAEVTRMWRVQALVFVTDDSAMVQTVRMIAMLGETGTTQVFPTMDEALKYARASREQPAIRGA